METIDRQTAAAQTSGYELVDRLTRTELAKATPEKHLGVFEKAKLRLRGRSDGKLKLPTKDTNDAWQSPFLKREAMEYSEYETKIWAKIQADLYPLYSKALKIMDDMRDANEMCAFVHTQFPPFPTEQELCQTEPGEEGLDPIAVKNRRFRAYKNEVARINSEIYALISRISADAEELSEIVNSIDECEKAARLLCSARRDRSLARVAVYWRSAMRKNKILDPLPSIILPSSGEELYDEKHREYHERINKSLSDKYRGGVCHEN